VGTAPALLAAALAVVAGTVVGIPLTIVLGRFLWGLFARQIDVVSEPIVPVPTVAVMIAGAPHREPARPAPRPGRGPHPRRRPAPQRMSRSE
jgi:hypothetical protein